MSTERVNGAKEGASDGMTVEAFGKLLDTLKIVGDVEGANVTTGAKENDGTAEVGSSDGIGDKGVRDG